MDKYFDVLLLAKIQLCCFSLFAKKCATKTYSRMCVWNKVSCNSQVSCEYTWRKKEAAVTEKASGMEEGESSEEQTNDSLRMMIAGEYGTARTGKKKGVKRTEAARRRKRRWRSLLGLVFTCPTRTRMPCCTYYSTYVVLTQ